MCDGCIYYKKRSVRYLIDAPIASVIIPIIMAVRMSIPAPFPDARRTRNNLDVNGPIIQTATRLMRAIQTQNMSNRRHSGITANTKPLIQGMLLSTELYI